MNKREELKKYSDFNTVNKKAKQLLGVGVDVSTRADKKYMIRTPDGTQSDFSTSSSSSSSSIDSNVPIRRPNRRNTTRR